MASVSILAASDLAAAAKAEEKKLLAFGASHLVLIVACFVSLLGCVYLYDSIRAERADSRAALAEQKARAGDSANQAVQQETAREIANLAEQNRGLQAQIGGLAQAMAARDAALEREKQTVISLPPSELATKWGAAAGEPAPVLTPAGGFIATLPLAQKSLIALEAVQTLTRDKQDLAAQVSKEQAIAGNNAAALGSEQAAHASDNAACKLDKQALQAEVTKVKRDAARSKFRWAAGGFLSGALTVLAHFL